MGLRAVGSRRGGLPAPVRAVVPLAAPDRVLAWALDQRTAGHVVVTRHALALVGPGPVLAWRRAWHEVDQGSWRPETEELTITWADARPPTTWRIRQAALFQQALRERIQASVVLAEEYRTRDRRRVRVAIRRNLATGGFLEQVMGARGVNVSDPEVAQEAAARLRRLRSEIGL